MSESKTDLAFRLKGDLCIVSVDRVGEVLDYADATFIACAPENLIGVVNSRDD